MAGKIINHVAISETVTMSASTQDRTEVVVPAFGDIVGVGVTISQSTTGTLTTAKTIEKCIKGLNVKDKSGNILVQNIRGEDLLYLEQYLSGKGRSRTISTTSSTAATEQFVIPINIEKGDQEARVQLSIAPYSDMAASGATGGSVTYSLFVLYQEASADTKTNKVQRITKSVASGANSFGIDLPKNVTIRNLGFKIGTEGNLTNIRFTSDGKKEFDGYTVAQMTALDNRELISGHTSGSFWLYNAPFVSTAATAFDVNASSSDTMEIFVVSEI